jgi:hypothetical protein
MKSHLSLTLHSCSDNCSLPRRWVQEIKCMHPVLLTHGLFFNLNTKQCYSQITHNDTYIYTDIHIQWFFWAPHSLLPVLALTCPLLCDWTPLFTYLENQLLFFMVRIPIHSCPWFAINCSPLAASPTPRHPIDQVTYLHRQHQQHRPPHPTQ